MQRLLSKVIDYAGLFPPAKLSMADAVANYHRYGMGSEQWIVSRFVCSTARLEELAQELERQAIQGVAVSAVGRPSTDRASWEAALEQDARDMNAFNGRGCGDVEAFEIRVPSNAAIDECVRDLRGFDEADVFVELPWEAGLGESLHALGDTQWLAAKARTGGLTADAFPCAEDLAGFLHLAISLDLDFKLTAGLHHPFRQWRDEVQGPMHGFLNVLAATALIFSEDMPRSLVAKLLLDEDPSAFRFDDQRVAWQGHEADLHAITEARRRLVAFGSCSVEEPLEDLAAAGLA